MPRITTRLKAAGTALIAALALLLAPAAPASAAPATAPGCTAAAGNGPAALWNTYYGGTYDRNQRFCLFGTGSENRQLHWIDGDFVIYAGNTAPGGPMMWASNLNGAGTILHFDVFGQVQIGDKYGRPIWGYKATYSKPTVGGWSYSMELFQTYLQIVTYQPSTGTYLWSPKRATA